MSCMARVALIVRRNRYWNVDVFGVLRGRYLSPAFAIKIGETAIRNSFRDQLAAIRQEGLDHLGDHPCVLTEFGIPFDMNDQHAYKTGDYSSQCAAMDANHYAVEGCGMNGFSLWVYAATVCSRSLSPVFLVEALLTMTHRIIIGGAIIGTGKTCPSTRLMMACYRWRWTTSPRGKNLKH